MEEKMETTIMGYRGIMQKGMEITLMVFWGNNWGYMCQSGFAFWSAASEDPGKGGIVFALCELQSRDHMGEHFGVLRGVLGV